MKREKEEERGREGERKRTRAEWIERKSKKLEKQEVASSTPLRSALHPHYMHLCREIYTSSSVYIPRGWNVSWGTLLLIIQTNLSRVVVVELVQALASARACWTCWSTRVHPSGGLKESSLEKLAQGSSKWRGHFLKIFRGVESAGKLALTCQPENMKFPQDALGFSSLQP